MQACTWQSICQLISLRRTTQSQTKFLQRLVVPSPATRHLCSRSVRVPTPMPACIPDFVSGCLISLRPPPSSSHPLCNGTRHSCPARHRDSVGLHSDCTKPPRSNIAKGARELRTLDEEPEKHLRRALAALPQRMQTARRIEAYQSRHIVSLWFDSYQ